MKYDNKLKLLNEKYSQPVPSMVRWLVNTNAEKPHMDNL